MKVDFIEMQKQIKEEILKSGHYAKIEIIISSLNFRNDGSNIPVVDLELSKIDDVTIAYLTRILEETSELILKDYNLKDTRKEIDKAIRFLHHTNRNENKNDRKDIR